MYLCECDSPPRCSFLSLVPQRFRGTPQWFVSHAWDGSFHDLVEGLRCELAPEPLPTEPVHPPGFKDGIFLWIGEVARNTYMNRV